MQAPQLKRDTVVECFACWSSRLSAIQLPTSWNCLTDLAAILMDFWRFLVDRAREFQGRVPARVGIKQPCHCRTPANKLVESQERFFAARCLSGQAATGSHQAGRKTKQEGSEERELEPQPSCRRVIKVKTMNSRCVSTGNTRVGPWSIICRRSGNV